MKSLRDAIVLLGLILLATSVRISHVDVSRDSSRDRTLHAGVALAAEPGGSGGVLAGTDGARGVPAKRELTPVTHPAAPTPSDPGSRPEGRCPTGAQLGGKGGTERRVIVRIQGADGSTQVRTVVLPQTELSERLPCKIG